ncbi:putative trans-sialidase [Trypanosoma cruzi]|nr:putative trans-sialidase [Trypanosoma cruzi]
MLKSPHSRSGDEAGRQFTNRLKDCVTCGGGFFSTLTSASSYTMPSECRRGGRAATKVSCYEATAIERTFRCGGPVQCPVVSAQPRRLDILEADGARFPAGQWACLWKLADPAVAEIASWHFCLDAVWRLGCVRSDFCAVRCFYVWGKPCHRNRIWAREAVEDVSGEMTDSD